MDPDQAASAQARLQHGLITRAQAREFGISDDAIDWRVKTGSWERIQRGVLRLPGAPATWQQGIMAPCLAIPGATASHQAAAALWEIPEVAARPEITVPHWHDIRLEGVQVHRAEKLDYRDRVWRSDVFRSPFSGLASRSWARRDGGEPGPSPTYWPSNRAESSTSTAGHSAVWRSW
jgi:hypothetical protein